MVFPARYFPYSADLQGVPPNMGLGQSKSQYLSEGDLSDDELDLDYFSTIQDLEQSATGLPVMEETNSADQTLQNEVDAVVPLCSPEQAITLQNVKYIEENELDEYELVALIYLLYDNCVDAVHDLKTYLKFLENPGILYKWAESREPNWKKKIVEALSIIKNYKALKQLGFTKTYLQATYLPLQARISCAVNPMRKVLYLIAEHLNNGQTTYLLSLMKKEFAKANITVPHYYRDYLELSFLYWEYSAMDFRDVQVMLKSMGFDVFVDEIESVRSSSKQALKGFIPVSGVDVHPELRSRKMSTSKDNTQMRSGSIESSSFSEVTQENVWRDSNSYDINLQRPGVALIINQEAFYTEPDEAYHHLLHEHKDDLMLENRLGTTKDKDRLESVLKRMNYKVIVKQNLAHFDMIKYIGKAIDLVTDESSLIVCILSHGDNGVVYGANSCKVPVSNIVNLMCTRNQSLVGRPKVLILQSCQGRQCQKIKMDNLLNENATDGPAKAPVTADLLTFWATIPGYAAIRNVNNGSWFIQALCDEIEQGNTRYHFLEICTRVVHKVTSKKWTVSSGINVMTPLVEFTLRKSFYLPPFRSY